METMDTMKRRTNLWNVALMTAWVTLMATLASAQAPPLAPPPPWAGNVSAGLTVTGGNSDVKQYNVGFEVVANPSPRYTAKVEGLALRGSTDGVLAVSRTSLGARDEYTLTSKTFVFGQVGYLRDAFKQIDYLIAPTAGVGYHVIKTDARHFLVDGGAGGVWEQDTGQSVQTSGAITAGESYTEKISAATMVSEEFRGLWKTNNFSDALLTFKAGLATAFVANSQLKIDFLDTYKNVPPSPLIKKNDTALVIAIVYKF